MVQTHAPGDEAAHREAGDGAMVTVGDGAVLGVDHRDEFLRSQLVYGVEVEHSARAAGHTGSGDEGLSPVSHDQHRNGFLSRDQVVQDVVHLSLDGPASLIFAAAVVDIEHRIALVGLLLIFSRNVNVAGPPRLGELRPVPLHTDLSVGHVLGQIEVHSHFGNLYRAGHPSGAVEQLARRVSHTHSVDYDGVIVEARNLRVAGHLPDAVGVFGHRIVLAEVQRYAFSLGSVHLEDHAQVGIYLGVFFARDVGAGRRRFGDEADDRFLLAGNKH